MNTMQSTLRSFKRMRENHAKCAIFTHKVIGIMPFILAMLILNLSIDSNVKAQSPDELPPPPVPEIASIRLSSSVSRTLEGHRDISFFVNHGNTRFSLPPWTGERYYWFDDLGRIEDADPWRSSTEISYSRPLEEGTTFFVVIIRDGDPSRYSGTSWAIVTWTFISIPNQTGRYNRPWQHAWVYDSEGRTYLIDASFRGIIR